MKALRCRVCKEPVEVDGPSPLLPRWRHAHADKDVYCGTGDGATAEPELPAVGARVAAVNFAPGAVDDNETVPPGTEGTVTSTNNSQVWVRWDNGANLALLIDRDDWKEL